MKKTVSILSTLVFITSANASSVFTTEASDVILSSIPYLKHETIATGLASQIAYITDAKVDEDHIMGTQRKALTEKLNSLDYELLHTYEKPKSGFRAQAWVNHKSKKVITAYRGTETGAFTDAFANVLSDVGITKYASLGHMSPEGIQIDPLAYLANHQYQHTKGLCSDAELQDEGVISLLNRLQHVSQNATGYKNRLAHCAQLGATLTAGAATSAFSMSPLGAALVAGSVMYGSKHLIEGYTAESFGDSYLLDIISQAITFRTKVLEKFADQITEYENVYTGHSLGGFTAATVANALKDGTALTFNAPGGHGAFLEQHGQTILGKARSVFNPYNYFTTMEKASCTEPVINIFRSTDTVGNVGGDKNRTQITLPKSNKGLEEFNTFSRSKLFSIMNNNLPPLIEANKVNDDKKFNQLVETHKESPKFKKSLNTLEEKIAQEKAQKTIISQLPERVLKEHGIGEILDDLAPLVESLTSNNATRIRPGNAATTVTADKDDSILIGNAALETATNKQPLTGKVLDKKTVQDQTEKSSQDQNKESSKDKKEVSSSQSWYSLSSLSAPRWFNTSS